jgi:hypothetical protein
MVIGVRYNIKRLFFFFGKNDVTGIILVKWFFEVKPSTAILFD